MSGKARDLLWAILTGGGVGAVGGDLMKAARRGDRVYLELSLEELHVMVLALIYYLTRKEKR